MQNIVERMDRLRTKFLKIFVLAFSLLIGFWMVIQLALGLLRPKAISSFGSSRWVWKRYFDFFNSILPALKISAFAGLFIFGVSLMVWLLYKRKTAGNPAIDTAVRDERVRLIWLLSFRKTAAAFFALQLLLWILQISSLFFWGHSLITPYAVFFLSLFVLVVTNLGTFLRLDRPQTELIFRLKAFEAAVIRKASSLFALYLGWHVLYMIGRIYWNWKSLHLSGDRDDPLLLRHLELSRVVQLAWIAVLAILVLLLIAPAFKASRAAGVSSLRQDERVQANWLKACRSSILVVFLALFFLSTLPYFAFNVFANRFPHDWIASAVTWSYVLSGLRINLLLAVTALLRSYLHYDRQD